MDAAVETVDPIILSTKVVEPMTPCCCQCCCTIDEIPDCVYSQINGDLTDDSKSNTLLVSLGFFSVVRIERPAQYLINAVEYCVPEKECVAPVEDDPCSLFRSMAFPVSEFCPPSTLPGNTSSDSDCGPKRCGCGN